MFTDIQKIQKRAQIINVLLKEFLKKWACPCEHLPEIKTPPKKFKISPTPEATLCSFPSYFLP